MITIPSELKPTLNTLIHYYRRHNEDPSFQAKNFVLNKDGIEICDVSTLSKLENNKIQCMDDIYFELLKKLNSSFIYDEIANNLIQSTNHALLKHAEINDVPKILSLLTKIIETLSTYKNCIVYKEYLEIYEILYDYYDDQKFNKEQIDKYIELYDLIEEELRPIFISIAYHYYTRVNIDTLLSLDLLTKAKNLKINSIIKVYLVDAYYVRLNHKEKMISESKKGIRLCKNNKNSYYLSRFYSLLSCAYRFDNPELAIKHLTSSIIYFDKKVDNYSTLFAYYHNMAHLCYDQKKYSTILYMYKKHLYNDVQFLTVFFYLLIDIINKTTKNLHEINRIINIVDCNSMNSTTFHLKLLQLFKNIYINYSFPKTIESANTLLQYKQLFMSEPLMKSIILNTIKDECSKNNQLQLYYEFVQKFQ